MYTGRLDYYPITIAHGSRVPKRDTHISVRKYHSEVERDCQCRSGIPQDRTYSRNVDSINSVRVAAGRRICQIRYSERCRKRIRRRSKPKSLAGSSAPGKIPAVEFPRVIARLRARRGRSRGRSGPPVAASFLPVARQPAARVLNSLLAPSPSPPSRFPPLSALRGFGGGRGGGEKERPA